MYLRSRDVVLVAVLASTAAAGRAEPGPAPARVDRFGDALPQGAVLRLGTTRLRHAGVCALAFTGDGKLVSFGGDYVVRTFDPTTGRQLAERAFARDKLYRNRPGCMSADGRRLAIQYEGSVKVFDVTSGQELAAVKLADQFGEAAARFSPDGGRLAVMEQEGQVHLLDIAANRDRSLGKVAGPPSDLAFSRDGKRLAVAALNSGVTVWDVAAGRELGRFKPTGSSAMTVDFDATGDVLAVLGFSNPPQPIQFVRISTGHAPDGWTLPTVGETHWARFAPDGSTLLLGRKDGARWFDPKAGKDIRTAAGPATVRPAFSADGKWMASGGPHAIRMWEVATAKSVVPAEIDSAPVDEVAGVAVSPDGKWIVTKGSDESLIHIWHADGRAAGTIRPNRWGGRYPVFSPDGKYLYGAPPDGLALVRWDIPSGKESLRYTFAAPADQVAILNFAVSTDGRRLAAISQTRDRRPPPPGRGPSPGLDTFTVWDADTAKRLGSRVVDGQWWFGYGAFDPDLRWFFLGARPLAVGGGPEFRLDMPEKWQSQSARVSSDGRLVAQKMYEQIKKVVDGRTSYRAESRGLVVHETATGKRVLTLPVEECGTTAFAADGRSLVVTGPDGITRWDLSTLKPVVRHKPPGPAIGSYGNSFASSLALFPDGTKAVTGHIDTTALVWDLTPPARPAKKLSKSELAAAWTDLAGEDAGRAYTAVWALADAPDDAVPFLRARLKPAAAPAEDEVRKLVAKLDAAVFAQREAAAAAIRELGDAAVPALRAALKAGLSAEQTTRVERLLTEAEAPTVPPGDRLRRVRAVAALEWAGTTEARNLLTELATGTAADRSTRDATAALRRVAPQ